MATILLVHSLLLLCFRMLQRTTERKKFEDDDTIIHGREELDFFEHISRTLSRSNRLQTHDNTVKFSVEGLVIE